MLDQLAAEAARLKGLALSALAAERAGQASLDAAGWHLDLARQHLDAEAETVLLAHGETAGLPLAIDQVFSGAHVNPSEDRPALHWALRAPAPLAGEAETVRQSLQRPLDFAEEILSGKTATADGERFTSVLHIGIGGSDFGPRLLADAFHAERERAIELRFCANLDPIDFELAVNGLDPNRTLVIGVSKSFGTQETIYNLNKARRWLETALGEAWPDHIALVTASAERARSWMERENGGHLFDMPLSVGGRFSLWSAASLACFIALGPGRIRDFLVGAAEMDAHVSAAPLTENLAARLALTDLWNASVLGHPMRAVLAYARRLRLLPAYLQQLEMESNGKSVRPDGTVVDHATAPALWGGEGTIGQHSYHQWLHQGTHIVPADFILALDDEITGNGRRALAAHALAQAEVLANGRSLDEVLAEEPDLAPAIAAQKVHAGGRPSSFFLCRSFDARALGALIALYEHRTYLAGCLWGVNPFDQWGVERGKTMARYLQPVLGGQGTAADPVTASLVEALRTG